MQHIPWCITKFILRRIQMNKSSLSLVFALIISALAVGGCSGKIGGPSDEEQAAQSALVAKATRTEQAEGEARSSKSKAEKAEKELVELKKNPPEQTTGLITPAQCAAIHAAAPTPAPRPVVRRLSGPRPTPAPGPVPAGAVRN